MIKFFYTLTSFPGKAVGVKIGGGVAQSGTPKTEVLASYKWKALVGFNHGSYTVKTLWYLK